MSSCYFCGAEAEDRSIDDLKAICPRCQGRDDFEIVMRLRAALRQAYEHRWGNIHISSTRGDCNCPHPVSYHPGDGHGFEQFADVLELDLASATLESDWSETSEPPTAPARDPLIALCDLLEAMPAIKDRALIEKAGGA